MGPCCDRGADAVLCRLERFATSVARIARVAGAGSIRSLPAILPSGNQWQVQGARPVTSPHEVPNACTRGSRGSRPHLLVCSSAVLDRVGAVADTVRWRAWSGGPLPTPIPRSPAVPGRRRVPAGERCADARFGWSAASVGPRPIACRAVAL
jgi:hypothetical protein